MTANIIKKILKNLDPKSHTFRKGDNIFKQGDNVSKIYYISEGKIKLVRHTVDGVPVILHSSQKGQTIAEASLFSDKYHCSAIATTAGEVLLVEKHDFLHYLDNNPSAMIDLLMLFSRQIRDLRSINEIKNIHSAKERILTYLRCNTDSNNVVTIDLTIKDLAYKIGLAHETFYRELKKLESEGVIQRNPKSITLVV